MYLQLINSNNVLIFNNVKKMLELIHAKRGVFRTAKVSLQLKVTLRYCGLLSSIVRQVAPSKAALRSCNLHVYNICLACVLECAYIIGALKAHSTTVCGHIHSHML